MSEQIRRYKNLVALGIDAVKASDYDALHAEAEALRDQNRDLRIEADGWFSRVNGVEAKLETLRAQHSGLSERHDVLSLAFNEVAGELEASRGLLRNASSAMAREGMESALVYEIDTFLTATLSPEVQASGPYASVADALAQRYPKPSLLKDCNVSYSNSSRPLAEQGERQETNQDVRALVRAGQQMANSCYNLSQFEIISDAVLKSQLRDLAKGWDEALAAHRKAQRKA